MALPDRFPILLSAAEWKRHPECPRSVPWQLVEPHERQARLNHSQSLERLAQRGGLDPRELVAVLENRRWQHTREPAEALTEMVARLLVILGQRDEP